MSATNQAQGQPLATIPDLDYARAVAGRQSAKNQNYTGIQNAVAIHTQTQSAANEVALAAVAVQAKQTGLFRGDIHVNLASGTTAKTVELRASLVPFATPVARFTQSIGTNVQLCAANTAGPALSWGGELNADAAGVSASGLLFNGVAPISTVTNAITLYDRKVDTLTGLLGFGDLAFDWSGQCGYGNGGAPATGFGNGVTALLVLSLISTAGGDVLTFASLSINLSEIA
jgi:hypothetical protein